MCWTRRKRIIDLVRSILQQKHKDCTIEKARSKGLYNYLHLHLCPTKNMVDSVEWKQRHNARWEMSLHFRFFVECSTLSKMSKNYKNTTAREKNYSVHCVSIVFTTLFSPTFLKILRKIRWLAILPCLCYGVDYRWWPSKREKREKL